jgi:hypothetical protein
LIKNVETALPAAGEHDVSFVLDEPSDDSCVLDELSSELVEHEQVASLQVNEARNAQEAATEGRMLKNVVELKRRRRG